MSHVTLSDVEWINLNALAVIRKRRVRRGNLQRSGFSSSQRKRGERRWPRQTKTLRSVRYACESRLHRDLDGHHVERFD